MTPLPVTPSFRLDGKRALVAGASSGIGLAAAVAMAHAGAEVTLLARREREIAVLAATLAAEGRSAHPVPLDITDLAAVAAFCRDNDPFDVLVNSAGLARHGPAVDTTCEDFDAAVDLNLRAAYFLSTEVARGLIAANRPGSILHVSSQMGHVGGIDRSVYSALKHALEGMTKSMAVEWGPSGIRVNTLCPTFVRTALTEQTFANPDRKKWIMEKIKLGRLAELSDLMGPVVFLASDASAMVTGTHLIVDGGWTAE
ncbi:SDR family NAD(P)-dependent oxidoreductase [Puniceibacterium sp. IMCC21224]|uniref:SDR family NAD(P)-dependent oxidoreductase n=1 Tax=Puniceibacterium sp. IMCC21224 TaxID=1618204 RepID=UPI00064E02C4|nr:SDR family oxidoreductase [Puniceibacterium sp. IMCC21224]KMK64501.1 dehydrogenase of unknown specificity, short-chain alcohol dehydrogenase like [Puniceibacterium sp. IMCC21224]